MKNFKLILLLIAFSVSHVVSLGQEIDTLNQLLDSANQGYSSAQNKIGVEYEKQKKHTEAIKWFLKAAEQNNVDAFFKLAKKYYSGEGVEKDMKIAFDYYLKAANLGHPKAEHNIGILYCYGIGVAADENEGIKWIKKAALKFTPSQHWLGSYYWERAIQAGKSKYNDERNKTYEYYEEAIKWLTLAADNGDVEAAINVANYLYKKENNPRKAMRYILIACEQKDANALKMYEEITGTSYSSLGKDFKNKVKTYTGNYPLGGHLTNRYKNNDTTYEYYELGNMRMFHGKFSVIASNAEGVISGSTLSIVGQFKDDYREGEWKVKYINNTFKREYDITMNYQNGKLNGAFECVTKDVKTGNVLIAEQTFYKNNIIVKKFTRKDIDGYYEEAGIDDEGNAHGKFIINSATGKIQGDFLHGTCNNFRYINLQTGDTEKRTPKNKCPISASWVYNDEHIMYSLHYIRDFSRGLSDPWRWFK